MGFQCFINEHRAQKINESNVISATFYDTNTLPSISDIHLFKHSQYFFHIVINVIHTHWKTKSTSEHRYVMNIDCINTITLFLNGCLRNRMLGLHETTESSHKHGLGCSHLESSVHNQDKNIHQNIHTFEKSNCMKKHATSILNVLS